MNLNYKLHIFISLPTAVGKPEIKTFEFKNEQLSEHDTKANINEKYSIKKNLSILNGEYIDIEVALTKYKNKQTNIGLRVLSEGDMLLGVQAEIGALVFWRSQLGSDVEFIVIPNEQLSHSSLGE